MARLAFLLCFPFVLAACAEEHHYWYPKAATAQETVSHSILGKTEKEVKEILKSGEMITIVGDASLNNTSKRIEIWYFSESKYLTLSATFVDGHAVAVVWADELLKDPKTQVKIWELHAKHPSATRFNVQTAD